MTKLGQSGSSTKIPFCLSIAIIPLLLFTQQVFPAEMRDIWFSYGIGAAWQVPIRQFLMNPVYPETIYFGTQITGISKSDDGGASWAYINTGLDNSEKRDIVSMAVALKNPEVLFTGTQAGGVFKSVDGGANWVEANNGMPISAVYDLEIDSNNPDIVYAATRLGVYKTLDGGLNWNLVGPSTFIYCVIEDPGDPAIIYAGTVAGIYKSADAGRTWERLEQFGTNEVRTLVINPQNRTLYAGSKGVFKSADGGLTWNSPGSGIGSDVIIVSLAIDPKNPNRLFASSYSNGINVSIDGGTTWQSANNGLGTTNVTAVAINPKNPEVLYAATFYLGLRKSTNGGTTWNELNKGLIDNEIQAVTTDPQNPAILYAGTIGKGIFKSTDGSMHWTNVGLAGLTITNLKVHPRNSSVVYAATRQGVYRSIDAGTSWSLTTSGLASFPTSALLIDNQNVVWAGGVGMIKSTDGGATWSTVNNSPAYVSIKILVQDPQRPGTIYIATDSGLYKTTDYFASWNLIETGLAKISGLAVDPQNSLVIYISSPYSGQILKSIDGGASWSEIIDVLEEVKGLALDPAYPDILYATVLSGVYWTIDGGKHWTQINNGLPPAGILSMTIASGHTVYLGTNWAGVLIYSPSSTPSLSNITINTAPPGQSFTVDGMPYSGDWQFSWTPGSSHVISAASQLDSGTRYIFNYWSDAGAASHTITVPPNSTTYTAVFKTQYALTMFTTPHEGGILQVSPTSEDGYYASGSSVQITATANSGYVFSNWSGDLSGNANPQRLTLFSPQNIGAVFSPETPSTKLSVPAGGAITVGTAGGSSTTSTITGYADIAVGSGGTPYGTAVFSLKQNGATVGEAGVPASPPTTWARIFVDYGAGVNAVPARSDAGTVNINTGIALVNCGTEKAYITYVLRDSNASTLTSGHGIIEARSHITGFIDQLKDKAAPDFNFPSNFRTGSLEILSDQPLSVLALRGTMNQRNEFLMTTTPIADLTKPLGNDSVYFPQFADGDGSTTSLILMNTSDRTETGILQIRDDNGNPLIVNESDGTANATFNYSIPAHGVFRFRSDGSPEVLKKGWVILTPTNGTMTPVSSGVFGYNPEDVLVSESGIPSVVATTRARIYVDLSGNHNTGLAVANIANSSTSIAIKAYQRDGITPAGSNVEPLLLQAKGHTAAFADQFISELPQGFTGVLDISSLTPFAALTIRSLDNERGDFLMTTFPIADANQTAPSPIIFPQIADGGGSATEFILISPGGQATTTLNLYDNAGTALELIK